jgi:hypothetical protein
MSLFSKKEKVPEIPPAPRLPELPNTGSQMQKRNLPELPSFPNGANNENINQEMVKSAVSDTPSSEENEVSVNIPEGLHIKEEHEEESMIPPMPSIKDSEGIPSIADEERRTLEISEAKPIRPATRQTEPIFVRIDKFQSAQKNFENIRNKVSEIESVISKIKNVKSKEEEELSGWAEDIEKIKSRLSEVDSDIFSQI